MSLHKSMFEFNGPDSKGVEKESIDGEDFIYQSIADPKKIKTHLKVNSFNLIQDLFFGKFTSAIIDKGGKLSQNQVEEVFGPMILNPDTPDFYKSWENYFITPLEDFGGSTLIKAAKYKIHLVSRFPDVLCFQINRAKYNSEKQSIEKNNVRFEMPLEIFTDRFLAENHIAVAGLRERSNRIRADIEAVDRKLDSYAEFPNSTDISESLQNVISFLEMLKNKDDSTGLPEALMREVSQEELASLRSIVSLKDRVVNNKAALLKQKQELLLSLKNLFAKIEKTKYVLYSIIIHDGTSESGHYYCFIQQRRGEWVKFNDFWSKPFSQEEVLALAYGNDKSYANAYCAFYMKDSLFRDALPHNYTLLPEGAKGPYFSAISPPLRQKIEKKNGEFEVEFVKQLTGKILSDYSKKCDSLFRSKEFIEKEKDIKSAVYSKGLKSLAEFVFSTSPLTQPPRRSTEKPKATSSSQSGYCSTTCSRQPRIRRAPWCTI